MTRRKFLKKAGIITAAATLGQVDVENVFAEQKPAQETDKEKEKYHLPAIEYQDKQLDGFVYQNSHDRTGKPKAGFPENGKILFFKESLSKKDNTVLRELDHELHHQNFDKLDANKQVEIAKFILSKYKIKDILANVLNEPTYEMQFKKLQKQYGQQAAEIYAVNEFLGFVMSYADYPPPEVKNPKEHFTEQQWAEFLSEEIKNGGTEETLIRQFKERPDLIVPGGSAAYDVSDKLFFEIQRSGMLIPDDLKRTLQEYGLTPNTERAKILFEKIKKSK